MTTSGSTQDIGTAPAVVSAHEHRWDRERERDFRRWHRHPH